MVRSGRARRRRPSPKQSGIRAPVWTRRDSRPATGRVLVQQSRRAGLRHRAINLGSMYMLGQGVQADEAEAIRWFEKAAAQGSSRALVNEARIYMSGKSTPHDYSWRTSCCWGNTSGESAAEPFLKQCHELLQDNPPQETETAIRGRPKTAISLTAVAKKWDARYVPSTLPIERVAT